MPKLLVLSLYDRVPGGLSLQDKTVVANREDLKDAIKVWASNADIEAVHDQLIKIINDFITHHSHKPHKNKKLRNIQKSVNRLITILEEGTNHGNNHSTPVLRRQQSAPTGSKHPSRNIVGTTRSKGVAGKERRQVHHVSKDRAHRVGSTAQPHSDERSKTAYGRDRRPKGAANSRGKRTRGKHS